MLISASSISLSSSLTSFKLDKTQKAILIVAIALAALSYVSPTILVPLVALPCIAITAVMCLYIRHLITVSSLKGQLIGAPQSTHLGSVSKSSPNTGEADPLQAPHSASTGSPADFPATPSGGLELDLQLQDARLEPKSGGTDPVRFPIHVVDEGLGESSNLAPLSALSLPLQGTQSERKGKRLSSQGFDSVSRNVSFQILTTPGLASAARSDPKTGGTDPLEAHSSASTCFDPLHAVYGVLNESTSSEISVALDHLMVAASPDVYRARARVDAESTPSRQGTLTDPVQGSSPRPQGLALFASTTPPRVLKKPSLTEVAFVDKQASYQETFEQLTDLVVKFAECITSAGMGAQETFTCMAEIKTQRRDVIDFTSVNALSQDVAVLFQIATIKDSGELAQLITYVQKKAPGWLNYVDQYQNLAAGDAREVRRLDIEDEKKKSVEVGWRSTLESVSRADQLLIAIQALKCPVED